MIERPKIYLVHALPVSMAPIADAFRSDWPQAQVANLLDDSLFCDFGRYKRLTDAMVERFREFGNYCKQAGADAVMFTCSAFGPAIDAVKRDQHIPVLKPNEALYDALTKQRGRVALLATFEPTLPSMMAEIAALGAFDSARNAMPRAATLARCRYPPPAGQPGGADALNEGTTAPNSSSHATSFG